MTRTLAVLAALALGAPALAAPPAAPRGKARAPATVSAALGAGTARVSVRFEAAARAAEIAVAGTGGLRVLSATPAPARDYAAGEVAALEVAFEPAAARAQLVVSVRGTFGGERRSTVRTFDVAARPGALPQKEAAGRTVTTSEGDRVKLGGPAGR